MENNYDFCGTHVIGEIYNVSEDKLNNLDLIVESLSRGVDKANATCIGTLVKKFEPQGLSVLMLLSESHVSIHTYPEFNALFFDAFTCGDKCNPELIILTLKSELNSNVMNINIMKRGNIS